LYAPYRVPLLFLIFDGGDYKLFINLTSHSARIIEVLVSLDSEYLFFARPKKRYEKKCRPDALARRLPDLLTIANASSKFASMLS